MIYRDNRKLAKQTGSQERGLQPNPKRPYSSRSRRQQFLLTVEGMEGAELERAEPSEQDEGSSWRCDTAESWLLQSADRVLFTEWLGWLSAARTTSLDKVRMAACDRSMLSWQCHSASWSSRDRADWEESDIEITSKDYF